MEKFFLDRTTAVPYIIKMHTVVEMPEFLRCAKKLGISDDEREQIVDFIAEHPLAGDEIPGTGGMRKVRIAAKGRGKSGGYRVITFFTGADIPVFLITAYAKSQKENITADEKKTMKGLSDRIAQAYRRQK